jgi:hypothetical protein
MVLGALWVVLLLGLFSFADSISVGAFSFDNLNPTGLAAASLGDFSTG